MVTIQNYVVAITHQVNQTQIPKNLVEKNWIQRPNFELLDTSKESWENKHENYCSSNQCQCRAQDLILLGLP